MNELIFIDSEIQYSKPVICRTQVSITKIIGGLSGGMIKEEIMKEYEVTNKNIRAVLKYVTELVWKEEFCPLPSRF